LKTVIVSCKTLELELEAATNALDINYPILWLESGLHSVPKKLKSRLQEILDDIQADRVLLVMGFCGNSVQDITAGDFELIIPRVDDCISLLIGSVEKRMTISGQYDAYFLTEGWLRGERNLWVEHQYAVEKFGEEQAKEIGDAMYGHYRTLGLLDSGVSPIEHLVSKTEIIADTLNLKQQVIPASTTYIKQLLTGPWPEENFLIKAPQHTIKLEDLQ